MMFPHPPAHHTRPHPAFQGLFKDPLAVTLSKNQVYNRVFVDAFGYLPGASLIVRNKYERIEQIMDIMAWWVIGVLGPIALDILINNRYSRDLRRRFSMLQQLDKRVTILQMPFEWLDKSKFKNGVHTVMETAMKDGKLTVTQLEKYGLKNLKDFTPKLAEEVLWGKLAILAVDLALMASKGQIYNWGKNKITELLSKRKGFSGEFNVASQDLLEQKSQHYEKTKQWRQLVSLMVGFGGSLLLPILIGIAMRKTGKLSGFLGKFKKLVPDFNYTDAVYMSKWVLLWQNMCNWVAPSLLASRDWDEFREKAVKAIGFDFIFFFGDEIIAGFLAKYLQKKHKLDIPIVQEKRFLGLKFPRAIPAHEIFDLVKSKAHPAYRQASKVFWISLIGSCAALTAFLPAFNIWYTNRKVKKEEAQHRLQKLLAMFQHPKPQPRFVPAPATPVIPNNYPVWLQTKPNNPFPVPMLPVTPLRSYKDKDALPFAKGEGAAVCDARSITDAGEVRPGQNLSLLPLGQYGTTHLPSSP